MNPSLFDTGTIVAFFRNHPRVVRGVHSYIDTFGALNLSVVTVNEMSVALRRLNATTKLRQFEAFAGMNVVIPVNSRVMKAANELYWASVRAGRAMRRNDLILAATALCHTLTLVSTNEQFSAIDRLSTSNWMR